jgi:hypothetical protein
MLRSHLRLLRCSSDGGKSLPYRQIPLLATEFLETGIPVALVII